MNYFTNFLSVSGPWTCKDIFFGGGWIWMYGGRSTGWILIDFDAKFYISDLLPNKTFLFGFAFSELMEISAVQMNPSSEKVSTLAKRTRSSM